MTAKNPGDPDPIVSLSESSNIINILLHTVYGVSCAHYAPSFEDLSRTVAVLPKYGLPIDVYLSPSTPLSTALSIHAPTSPLELYSLAASLDLYHLAVTASAHLLSLSPPLLSDECAVRMGPIYLKRLFVLHLGRTDTLKRLLLVPPRTHTPTGDCDYSEQKRVTRAWALASAYLLLDARADMGVGTIEAALLPLAGHAGCSMCKATLVERIKEVVLQWSSVKVSQWSVPSFATSVPTQSTDFFAVDDLNFEFIRPYHSYDVQKKPVFRHTRALTKKMTTRDHKKET